MTTTREFYCTDIKCSHRAKIAADMFQVLQDCPKCGRHTFTMSWLWLGVEHAEKRSYFTETAQIQGINSTVAQLHDKAYPSGHPDNPVFS